MNFTFRPLTGFRRTAAAARRRSPFRASYDKTRKKLVAELEKIRARNVVVQVALSESEIRRDGVPYANARPSDPAVVVAFEKRLPDGRFVPLQFPCDRFDDWADNLRAIALSLEALRKVDRYGVTSNGEQYRGWNALPPATPIRTEAAMTVEDAARFLSRYGPTVGQIIEHPDVMRAAYREAAKILHPDFNRGVVSENWQTLQRAKAVLEANAPL